MSTINIRNVSDPFERYKMPALEARRKNKGSYHSTYITNLPAIAKALKVNRDYLVKHFAWSLKTNVTWQQPELHLKGDFTQEKLSSVLRDFINHYVLCQTCDLPEIDYVLGNSTVKTVCRACGAKCSQDPKDKYWAFVFQHLKQSQQSKKDIPVVNVDLPNEDDDADDTWADDLVDQAKENQNEIKDSKLLKSLLQS